MKATQDQHQHLIDLVTTKMPYGKYQGRYVSDLPEFYLVWYRNKGFPKGKLGQLMATAYEIKLNGIEKVLDPIKRQYR